MPAEVLSQAMGSQKLVGEFKKVEVFRLGEFTLKNGFKSPIYIDCRVLISNPQQMVSDHVFYS